MEYNDLMRFLEKEKLFNLVKDNSFYFQNIFKNCLNAKKEKVLIISDLGKQNARTAVIMAASYYFAAMRLNLRPELILQDIKAKTDPADSKVIEALARQDKKNIVILATSGSLGSIRDITKTFRGFCKKRKQKFVSTSGLLELPTSKYAKLISAMDVDYNELYKKGSKIKKILDKAKKIRIQTMKGTDLIADIKGTKSILNVGYYKKYGTGGNIPAGEVYLPPIEGSVNGKVVIDGSLRHKDGTTLIKSPVTLVVRDGSVTEIKGTGQEKKLIQTIEDAEKRAKYPENVRKLSEIGIGINPKAELAGPNMINEKTMGTAHVALGSNAWFGGTIYSVVHLDHVFKKPKIIVDDKLLVV